MQDFVSRWMSLISFVALMSAVCGVLIPGFPWASLLWVTLSASLALWMLSRTSTRSTAQVIWDVEGEPVRVAAESVRVVSHPPKSVLRST